MSKLICMYMYYKLSSVHVHMLWHSYCMRMLYAWPTKATALPLLFSLVLLLPFPLLSFPPTTHPVVIHMAMCGYYIVPLLTQATTL